MPAKAKQGKRSPIREADKPLRNPGESIREEMDKLWDDKFVPVFVLAIGYIALAIYEWFRWIFNAPPQPIPATVVAVIVSGFAVYRLLIIRKRYRDLRLGLEGEKRVGQFLENLRREGCEVFHDIPGDGFNIDHVVVSPHGVFVIETKTYIKPI